MEAAESAADSGIAVFLMGGDMTEAVRVIEDEDRGGRKLSPNIIQSSSGGSLLAARARGVTNLKVIQALLKGA